MSATVDNQNAPLTYTAFAGQKQIAAGGLDEVALKVKKKIKTDTTASVLVFSDLTGKRIDLDLSGSDTEIIERLRVFLAPKESTAPASGPGRPKLGVVAREVSLLPRHWEWLATQPGGASGTLRRLVEEAKKSSGTKERVKLSQERAYQFMSSLAGNLPQYEEALRALFAKDKRKFTSLVRDWPGDIQSYAKDLAEEAWN